jgi:hypothetical protein
VQINAYWSIFFFTSRTEAQTLRGKKSIAKIVGEGGRRGWQRLTLTGGSITACCLALTAAARLEGKTVRDIRLLDVELLTNL